MPKGPVNPRTRFGFSAAQLVVLPYVGLVEIQNDFAAGNVKGLWRKRNGWQFLHRSLVEDYYLSKNMPDEAIADKLLELGVPRRYRNNLIAKLRFAV